MHLFSKIRELNSVGAALEKRLQSLGIHTAEDLLWYFPFRYEDYRENVKIRELEEGQQVGVQVRIELIATKRSPRKRTLLTEALVVDDTGEMRIVWFGQPYISKTLKAGDQVIFTGKIGRDMLGLQMVNPSYQKVSRLTVSSESKIAPSTPIKILPVYPLTYGLTQKQLRFLVEQVLPLRLSAPDWLPVNLQTKVGVIGLSEALQSIHFPASDQALQAAEKRLKFDELFILQLRAEMIRQSLKRFLAPALPFQEDHIKQFVSTLPFTLTADQKLATWEILQDLQKTEPMNRLLEGDVGSGKTVVAAIALYQNILSGFQGVVMVPTEILATQHYETLSLVFARHDVKLALFTRSQAEANFVFTHSDEKSVAKRKKSLIAEIQSGTVQIVIGTHALLSETVQFHQLGLVVVDEQHRFGVEQRKTIREKSGMKDMAPHFLSMTATPIPRSFALTLYGDLDLSIIKQKPVGRKEIKTRVVAPHLRERAYQFIREEVQKGRQAFVICPLVQDNEAVASEKKSVLAEYEKLSQEIFPDLRIGYVHGKMKGEEKQMVMEKFAKGEIDVLVSTSVIEVGVNIPNASIMMIEGAESFGLAQLHQFRGRVGRSVHQSYCLLFPSTNSQKVSERLGFFEKTSDGFALSEYDLETRGPGEVYGKTQSGMMNFRLASMKDGDIIRLARATAKDIDFAEFPSLKKRVQEWEARVHLE